MISFTKLKQLADECFAITGQATSVEVRYFHHTSENKDTFYVFYQANEGHQYFKTVQEIIEAMERIKQPLVDEEVDV